MKSSGDAARFTRPVISEFAYNLLTYAAREPTSEGDEQSLRQAIGSDRSSPLDQLNQQYDDGNDQKQVNESANSVAADKT